MAMIREEQKKEWQKGLAEKGGITIGHCKRS
ncbi:hypothetical protein JOC74_003149 [Bacillus capparidis]|uniref:Uncharacterized protein n=1 Tax=Bacillus capparidis TaxID=1840411 RepID=A0ABS4CZ40_9BACI|nr:hypothetical protein [Bacillus capparidis]